MTDIEADLKGLKSRAKITSPAGVKAVNECVNELVRNCFNTAESGQTQPDPNVISDILDNVHLVDPDKANVDEQNEFF
jgi:hypothetical protein